MFIVLFALSSAPLIYYIYSRPNTYSTNAVIKVTNIPPTKSLLIDEDLAIKLQEKNTATEIIDEISNDHEIFQRTFDKVSFKSKNENFESFYDKFLFEPKNENNKVIKVSFTSKDPEYSFAVVKAFVSELILQDIVKQNEPVRNARRNLEKRLEQSEQEYLKEREILVSNFTQEELYFYQDGLSMQHEKGQENNQKEVLSALNAQDHSELNNLQGKLNSLQINYTDILAFYEMEKQLNDLYKDLAEKKRHFTDDNSSVSRLNKMIVSLEDRVRQRRIDLGSLLELDKNVIQNQITQLKNQIKSRDQQISQVQDQPIEVDSDTYLELDRAFSSIDVKKDEINQLRERLDDLIILESTTEQRIQLLWKPELNKKPDEKYIITKLVTVLAICLAFSMIIIAFIDSNDGHLRSLEELQTITKMHTICEIPELKQNVVKNSIYDLTPFYVQQISTFIMVDYLKKKGGTCFFITSCQPGDGKSTVAASLASDLSQTVKTVLIDCDLRRPHVHELFNISNDCGLIQHISEEKKLHSHTVAIKQGKLDIITTGGIYIDGMQLFTSARFKEFVEQLKENYEVVIFDTPPLSVTTETFQMQSTNMLGILVINYKNSKKNVLQKSLADLKAFKVEIIGTVVNQIPKTQRAYYDYYYSKNKSK